MPQLASLPCFVAAFCERLSGCLLVGEPCLGHCAARPCRSLKPARSLRALVRQTGRPSGVRHPSQPCCCPPQASTLCAACTICHPSVRPHALTCKLPHNLPARSAAAGGKLWWLVVRAGRAPLNFGKAPVHQVYSPTIQPRTWLPPACRWDPALDDRAAGAAA